MRTAGILGSLAIIAAAGFGWYSMAMTPSSGSGEKAPVGVSLEESMKKEMAVKTVNKENLRDMYLAGGCFWGLEEYFSRVDGVVDVVSGYANGKTDKTDYEHIGQTDHAETVALLSKLDVDKHIDVEIKLDELDLTSAESKATYAQIKKYILEKFDLKVSTLYIAQIKKKCGIALREHYNKSKKEKQVIPQCTPEKEEAIMDALRHFKMI